MTETLPAETRTIEELLSNAGLRGLPVADGYRAEIPLGDMAAAVARIVPPGRFTTLTVAGDPPSLVVAVALHGALIELTSPIDGAAEYPAVSAVTAAAGWPERAAMDTNLVFPHGLTISHSVTRADADEIRPRLAGEDAFVIPYGPVRSGVFEAIQFIIETGGEDIPLIGVRTGFKHRRLEARLQSMTVQDGAAVAERVAGISSVAHAIAYSQAVERALGITPPPRAELLRALHAELERIANHLHCAAQLAETTALSVGAARFTILKEEVMQLRAEICGSRFGRGVVVPGGVSCEPGLSPASIAERVETLDKNLRRDRRLLVGTTSFTDRLFGTGRLPRDLVEQYACVGPVARGSGVSTDARFERPYGAYQRLGWELATRDSGDAMARLEVRLSEMAQSLHIIRQINDRLRRGGSLSAADVPAGSGTAWGWAEAAQGEVLYRLGITAGIVNSAHIASPSLRNWQVFSHAFPRDVLTDFGFIEHSFGLTPAGADG